MSPSSWLQELASPITCAQRSIKWFFERRWRITASDVPKIFGRSQYGNAANVLQDKLNPQPAQPTAAQQRGIDGEERAVQAFLRSHVARQLAIVDCIEIGLLVHPGAPWLAASSDRVLTLRDGRKMLLEVKCYGQHPGDALPEAVRLQVEVQLGVAQAYGLFDTPGGSPTEPTAYVCIVNSSSFEPFGIWSVQHSAAAALDRHNHHVDHIVSHQLLDFDEISSAVMLSAGSAARAAGQPAVAAKQGQQQQQQEGSQRASKRRKPSQQQGS
uniref:YqaJ viral recombinase domain-containing protein n=1 Tax=Tetradesmus obliquus TaxID=3088 RepID=A0A383VPR2_TETOB